MVIILYFIIGNFMLGEIQLDSNLNFNKDHIELSRHEYYLDVISLFFITAQILVLFFYWNDLEGRVPIHFNFLGSPDGYGSKYVLLVLPVISLLFFLGVKSFRFIKLNIYMGKYDEKLSVILYKLYRSWTSLITSLTMIFFFMLLYFSINIPVNNFTKIPFYIIVFYFLILILSLIFYGIIEFLYRKKYYKTI